jgi:hypothetical protein
VALREEMLQLKSLGFVAVVVWYSVVSFAKEKNAMVIE